ncbi:hypothetical protein ACN2WE_05365 [Streptomyces sp. cg28]|uniref:hypothetical protein n=1 Tax=Streptomyces sp. cg28 TaxID=3403457 RepID=UPI003B22321D
MTDLHPLTPQTLGDILESEPGADVRFDGNMRAIGVDLPSPAWMSRGEAGPTKAALFGDQVGQDRDGHWVVVRPSDPVAEVHELRCEIAAAGEALAGMARSRGEWQHKAAMYESKAAALIADLESARASHLKLAANPPAPEIGYTASGMAGATFHAIYRIIAVFDGPEAAQRYAETRANPAPCGPTPDQCDAESGEPCADHEREQAHADGEHELCEHDEAVQR